MIRPSSLHNSLKLCRQYNISALWDVAIRHFDVLGIHHRTTERRRACKTAGYDVVLLDITMPGMDGVDVLSQLKDEKPRLPVLMLSMHPEEQYAVRALRAGASGYLTKESAPEELVTVIRKVSAGGRYVSSSLAERLAAVVQENAKRLPHETLSNREYQVMCLIATGKTVMEIAKKLSLSVKTISTYRSRILEKMKMNNNAELTRYAIENRLIE